MKKKKDLQAAVIPQKSCRYSALAGCGRCLPFFLLPLVCLAVYYNSLSNGFVYDDFVVIVENDHLKHLSESIPSFFSASYFKIAAGEASYRPIATLSYYLLYPIAGLNPFYYHLGSVILHILNTILVYLLVRSILKNRVSALMAGLLFACHPALTEAVDCISYNEDLLAGIFFLSALLFYLKVKTPHLKSGVINYGLSLLLFFFGLLSKEMAITLPAIVVLYDLTLGQTAQRSSFSTSLADTIKAKGYLYLGYLAVTLFYLFIRFWLLYNPREALKPFYGNIWARIIYLPGHIFDFIRLAVFPIHLNADYVFAYPKGFFGMSNLVGFSIVIGLAAISFRVYKHWPQIFFGIWWFLITLFPVYNLIAIYNPFADRYLYIPIIGFCLIVPVIIDAAATGAFHQPIAIKAATRITVALIIGLFATVSVARNRDWKDGLTLWSKTVQRSAGSFVAHGNLGRAYQERGMLAEAVAEYEKAIEIYPNDYKAYYNLGVVSDQQNALEKAAGLYRKAIEIYPRYVNAHFNLANVYHKQGLLDEAAVQYKKVIELDPGDFEAHNNLGVVYARQGKLDQAVLQWEKVLQLDPQNAGARNNIRKAQKMTGPSVREP